MWLTGFDAPSMHTMYVDKTMKGHGLMQAIARVNRVFSDKPAGLVVDYIGIAQNLKTALGQYSASDQKQAGIDEAEAVAEMLNRFGIVRDMFHGFNYRATLGGTPKERLPPCVPVRRSYYVRPGSHRKQRQHHRASASVAIFFPS